LIYQSSHAILSVYMVIAHQPERKTAKGRLWFRIGLAIVIIYAVLCTGLFIAMKLPPDRFGHVMSKVPMVSMLVLPFETLWNIARAGDLKAGDLAPDFQLAAYDKSSSVQLSKFRGDRPVVLIFGSYT
jgi:hypothetical protein